MLLKYRFKKKDIYPDASRGLFHYLIKIPTFVGMWTLLLPLNSSAQDYVPPPLFEAPPEIQQRIKKQEKNLTIFPKPSEKPKPLLKKDIPPPPRANPEKEANGVVKGPKTMPSAPAKSVESEVLYAPEQTPDLIIPQIPTVEENNNVPDKPEFIPPLPAFETLSDQAFLSTLYYVSDVITLSQNNHAILKHLILPELQKSPTKRLLIQAFASPQADQLDGDRRISLSRSLAIRRFLIEQGISPSRLDVRALGAQTNTQPLDRVELIIR